MSRVRSSSLSLVLALALGCDAPAPEREAPSQPEPVPEPEPTPELVVELEPAVEPVALPEPKPVFDATTVLAIRAKILAIPNRKSWVPCGYVHSVAVLEVEVLDVGEPPPRMLLFVSCPVDLGVRERGLDVGATISVRLYARKQSWPSVTGLPKDLPRRYVKSFEGPSLLRDPG